MSGSTPKPYQRLVLAPRSVPTGATAAAPSAAAPTAFAATAAAATTVAAPAARSSIFGAAKRREQVLLEKCVDAHAMETKLDQRTQRLPRMNKAQEKEFKELESLLASAIATAASENASVVRECVCMRVRVIPCQRVAAQSPSTVPTVRGLQVASCSRWRTAPEQIAHARPPADALRDEGDDDDVTC